ncbi:MAG: sugar transferase [Candidatus Hinthialibacter sp.]
MKKKGAPKGPLWKFICMDVIVIFSALAFSFLIKFQELRYENLSVYITLILPIVLVRIAALFAFRLYDFSRTRTQFDIIYLTFWASVLAHSVEFLGILYVSSFTTPTPAAAFDALGGVASKSPAPAHQVSRSILLLNFLLSWWMSCGWRIQYLRRRRRWAYDRSRILIVGAGALGESVQKDIAQYSKLGHEVIGLIDDNIENPAPETPVLGGMQDLDALVEKHSIDEIIVTSRGANRGELLDIISTCQRTGCTVRMLPELYEVIIGQVVIGQVAGIPLITVEPESIDDIVLLGKRTFDLVFGILFLIILLPVYAAVALVIRLNSRGPVLYRQKRVGKDGKQFIIYKFRTMYENAELETGPVISWEKDPRVTPVGRFLRRWRLDETPQLFNVLKGDMSLVGPRPERPHFVEKYKQEIPAYHLRDAVKPGVTGLAQIHGFYNSPVEHKLRYDLAYINNISILLDLKILFNTIRAVVSGRGILE